MHRASLARTSLLHCAARRPRPATTRTACVGRAVARRRLTTSSSAPSSTTSTNKSAFELEEAPLFSLRTRLLFYTTIGTLFTGSVLNFWFGRDRENAYWAEEHCPEFVRIVGPYVGLPVIAETGRLDREALGPRDVRDMVGERVSLVAKTRDGRTIVLEADALESAQKLVDGMKFEDVDMDTVKAI